MLQDGAGAILFATEQATLMASKVIRLFGETGHSNNCLASRLLRDAKRFENGAAASEGIRSMIARELFPETGRQTSSAFPANENIFHYWRQGLQ